MANTRLRTRARAQEIVNQHARGAITMDQATHQAAGEIRRENDIAELVRLVKDGAIRHTKARRIGPGSVIFCYGRDSESPTGVRLIHTVDDCDEADAILRDVRLAPLGPMEEA